MESQSLNLFNESVCTDTNSAEIDDEPVVQSDTTIQSEVTKTTEIQMATVSLAETDINMVKSQLSNCSIITVSSSDDGRDDTADAADENKDESIEIFEHTILPSSQESQNDISKSDPAIEISLLATPVTSGGECVFICFFFLVASFSAVVNNFYFCFVFDAFICLDKRVVSTNCEFNTTNLIDFDSTMNITNTKYDNNSVSLTPCPSARIIPEKNDDRIEAMINTENLFEYSDLIEIDNDNEIESTEPDNNTTIEIGK